MCMLFWLGLRSKCSIQVIKGPDFAYTIEFMSHPIPAPLKRGSVGRCSCTIYCSHKINSAKTRVIYKLWLKLWNFGNGNAQFLMCEFYEQANKLLLAVSFIIDWRVMIIFWPLAFVLTGRSKRRSSLHQAWLDDQLWTVEVGFGSSWEVPQGSLRPGQSCRNRPLDHQQVSG